MVWLMVVLAVWFSELGFWRLGRGELGSDGGRCDESKALLVAGGVVVLPGMSSNVEMLTKYRRGEGHDRDALDALSAEWGLPRQGG
jgi:hypothetical protein